MTTTTLPTPGPRTATAVTQARLSFPGVLRAEWIKLVSLRSTWWSLGVTVAVMTLLALAHASSVEFFTEVGDSGGPAIHGAEIVTGGYQVGMVVVAVLGALLMTGEYSTGMIRSTLAAVPTRLPVLVAKALALTLVTAVAGALSLVTSYLATAPILRGHSLVPALDDPLTWQAFGGMVFFFVAAALVGLGLGAVLRHTAGTITAAMGLLLLAPMVLQFLTFEWVRDAVSLLPLPAGQAFLGISGFFGGNELLSPWQGAAVVGAYAAVALAAGALVLRRRDA